MSFRLTFPAPYREEEITLARIASQRNARTAAGLETFPGARLDGSGEASPSMSPVPQKKKRVVLPDPVAFKFLEEDPSVTLIERKKVLQGYELYLVEQWACSRKSPTLVIATYTGDPSHSAVVGVLGVPEDEKDWSPRLRQYHARPKETEAGELMVTNLSSFPSALTVIAIPDGDIRKHRQIFIINEDLKRLGCSGRSGMTLSDPTPATQAKFLQLYKTSDRIPFFQCVLELVKMCQTALFIFDKLEQEYIDGLLCDVTESAINNWWTEIGSEYYNIEPTDGILGPTTVAALLGTLMGARNRLSYYGAPITKDVFDVDNMKKGIGTFQKAYKLERTRRLDRKTLLKLHNVTAKAAAGEGGWGVQKAVKSTVAEIGGKRGELVIGMVGGKEKAGIGDIETADFDRFISLVYGEKPKWLWHGKARRTGSEAHDHSMSEASGLLFGKDSKEDSGQTTSRRTQSLPLDEEVEVKRKEDFVNIYSAPPPGSTISMADSPGDKDPSRKTVFRSVAGKVSDARSGFGRIRDAVGSNLRGHVSRPSKDETPYTAWSNTPSIATLAQSSAALSSPVVASRAFTWKNRPEEYVDAFKKERDAENATIAAAHNISDGVETPVPMTAFRDAAKTLEGIPERRISGDIPPGAEPREIRRELIENDPSVAGSVVDDCDLQGPVLEAERNSNIPVSYLQRRHSINISSPSQQCCLNENRWPHRLSFSEAEEALLRWDAIVDMDEEIDTLNTLSALQQQHSAAEMARSLYASIASLQQEIFPWVSSKLSAVESLDDTYARQQESLQNVYYQLSDAYQRLKHSSSEMLAEERAHLAEAVKDVEVLVAKLEYEINALVSKVQDVEDGVSQFEKQVEDVEARAAELKAVLETESWLHWAVRTLTGIGTGPNITQETAR
ncbi:hypothetical protein CONLIGDRAFT_692970 [Coniochaeta ligniaria NRRL 30616]|uniref:STB6-like N-terminal domain-containing protein n=1 Tax=Coniochaeta ligniaria NRRL 30616 TaxID=1408157 RepID=A0A1J7J2G3_9PEZI|nr:hypothetical protein CONLIGDRAFT_692970 [Coniochaeta ligniaria NRRL 30616]